MKNGPDIKICGLTDAAAVEAAVDGGATHVGFIFFERSPRHVSPERAAELARAARGRAAIVAVTVDAPDATLDAIVAALDPDMLQLHGHESPERVAAVKARYKLPVIKAFAVRDADDLAGIAAYRAVADRLLFDAKPPRNAVLPGGNGVSFDWSVLAALDADVDYMLSGGLSQANIAAALAATGARGIDISSGVESAPGVKDVAKIAAFFDAIRRASSGEAQGAET